MDHTLYQKPQLNLSRSTLGRMWLVSCYALLAILQSSLGDNFHSLFVALAAAGGALVTEFFFNLKNWRRVLKDGSAIASGLILALLLPNTIYPLFAFLGAVFAMTVVKHSFGGLGSNWVNPAAAGWLFIRASWPAAFNQGIENSHLAKLAASLEGGLRDPDGSPLALLKINGWSVSNLDNSFTSFLNDTIFSLTGVRFPQGYISLLSLPGPGIIADRGLFFLLLGTALLAAARCFRLWIPLGFLLVYSLLTRIFGALSFGGGLWEGDVLFALFSGGVLAAAFTLVADPATGPKSTPGYAVFICLTAFLAFLFRYSALDPYGAVSAVLLGNTLAPLIRGIENAAYYEKRRGYE
ncbi:MAG: RnfABCDGE type electron transport complex subunit D [Treponema sp.]|jgi:electron transport complex protein RnfD|nr:RnfABCDGE type electron transport complex subunit D [Treponema sp.]